MQKRRLVHIAALAAVTLATCRVVAYADDTGVVKGSVIMPPGSGPATATVVYLEGQIGTVTPKSITVDQRDQTFVPHVVALVKGGSVDFVNSDPVLHNVYAASSAKRFDLGMYGRGEHRSVQFDKPGVVEVRCNVHPKMRAFIVVLDNQYFSITDDQGNFQITGVPAGRYKLHAWHEGFPVSETWANLEDTNIRNVEIHLQR